MLALVVLSSITKKGEIVAKMASHAIFQYNVLAIDDTHNTWTNVIIKMTILRLLGSSDDKEKRGVARPEGPPLRGFRYPVSGRGSRGSRPSRVSGHKSYQCKEIEGKENSKPKNLNKNKKAKEIKKNPSTNLKVSYMYTKPTHKNK